MRALVAPEEQQAVGGRKGSEEGDVWTPRKKRGAVTHPCDSMTRGEGWRLRGSRSARAT